jgi:dCMP deaminase
MRPSWDEYFMKIAEDVATRSTCIRRQVGAVIVKDKRILSTGYNGAPKGVSHCTAETCIRNKLNIPSGEKHELCRGLHAEQNAIIQAAAHGLSIAGASIYVTNQPCSICTKMLINCDIRSFLYRNPYNDPLALEMMEEADVKIVVVP